MAIAEQMGVTLANTAYSVNIKERLDFSCALFDADGNLIANAPHMPVHLGSMGESVRTIIERRAGTMRAGDAFVLNAPYNGGTHLPDVTVIAPVFLPVIPTEGSSGGQGFQATTCPRFAELASSTSPRAATMPTSAASRPGSMPPDSTHVDEEGVLLDNVAARRRRALPRGGDARDPRRRPLSGAQCRPEPGRSPRAGRGVREGRGGAREDGRALRPAGRSRLHAARAGQRGGVGAPRARRADRRTLRVRDGQRRANRRRHLDRQGERARRPSTSPGRARSSRPISTRRPPSARPRCSTSSARSSTTRSR